MSVTNRGTTEHFISPTHYVTGHGATQLVGPVAGRYGARAMLVHGAVGYPLVEDVVASSLAGAALAVTTAGHAGPCTQEAVEAHAQAARSFSAEVVVGIGGGRVLDTAKGVAEAINRPCVTVPTSPATCAAATAAVVYYDSASVYVGSRPLREPPVAAVVDRDVIARAPDRLLVAGVVDALAKYHEVRFAAKRAGVSSATMLAALALCDGLEALMEARAAAVLGGGLSTGLERERIAVAEAVLLWPGLIGGLAGEASKLAAAHAIHNALTLLPGSKRSLHGEILAFGILVQRVLDGVPPEAVRERARFFGALGCPCSLEALGCGAFYGNQGRQVVSRALALPSMKSSFPDLTEEALRRAMVEADGLASAPTARH